MVSVGNVIGMGREQLPLVEWSLSSETQSKVTITYNQNGQHILYHCREI